jgi:hypothetical protein
MAKLDGFDLRERLLQEQPAVKMPAISGNLDHFIGVEFPLLRKLFRPSESAAKVRQILGGTDAASSAKLISTAWRGRRVPRKITILQILCGAVNRVAGPDPVSGPNVDFGYERLLTKGTLLLPLPTPALTDHFHRIGAQLPS